MTNLVYGFYSDNLLFVMSIGPDKEYLKLLSSAFPHADASGQCSLNSNAATQRCFSSSNASIFSQSSTGLDQAQTGSWSWTPWLTKARAETISQIGIPMTVYNRAQNFLNGIGSYVNSDGSTFTVDNVMPQPFDVGPGSSISPSSLSSVSSAAHAAGGPWCMQGPYGDAAEGNWCTTNMQFVPQASCDPSAKPVMSTDLDPSTGKSVCGGAAEGDPVCIPSGVGLEPVPMACFKDISEGTPTYWSLEASIPKVNIRFCGVDSSTNAPLASSWDNVRQACVCIEGGGYPQDSEGNYFQGPAAHNSCVAPAKTTATAPSVWTGVDDIANPDTYQIPRMANITAQNLTTPEPNLGMCYLMDPTKTLYLSAGYMPDSPNGQNQPVPTLRMLPGRPDSLWLISAANTTGSKTLVSLQTVIGTKIYYLDIYRGSLGLYASPQGTPISIYEGHLSFGTDGFLEFNNGDKSLNLGNLSPMTPGYTTVLIEKITPTQTSISTLDDSTAVANICGLNPTGASRIEAPTGDCDLDNPSFWATTAWTDPTDLLQKTVTLDKQPTTVSSDPVFPSAATHPATTFLLTAMTGRMDHAKSFGRGQAAAMKQATNTRLDGWEERPGYIPTQGAFGQAGSTLGFNIYGQGSSTAGKTLYLYAQEHPVRRGYYMLALTASKTAVTNPENMVTYNPGPFFSNAGLSLGGSWNIQYDPSVSLDDPYCYFVFNGVGLPPKGLVDLNFETLANKATPANYPLTCITTGALQGVTITAYGNPLNTSGQGIALITKPWTYDMHGALPIEYAGDSTSYSDPVTVSSDYWTYRQQTNNAWKGTFSSEAPAPTRTLPIEYTTALAACETSCSTTSSLKSTGGLALPGVGIGVPASSYTCPPCSPHSNLSIMVTGTTALSGLQFGIIDGGVNLGAPSDGTMSSHTVADALMEPASSSSTVTIRANVTQKVFALVVKPNFEFNPCTTGTLAFGITITNADGSKNENPLLFPGTESSGSSLLYNLAFVSTLDGGVSVSSVNVPAEQIDGSQSNVLHRYAPAILNENGSMKGIPTTDSKVFQNIYGQQGYYAFVANYKIQ